MKIKKTIIEKTKKEEKQTGITLIALVVTIVVLLIIAAVSIGILTEDNGIIKQSQEAKEGTEIAKEIEMIEISTVQAAEKDKWGEITEENLEEALNRNIGDRNIDYELIYIEELEWFKVTYIASNRSYLIDADGNVIGQGKITNIPVTGVTISETNIVMQKGETSTITVSVKPSTATNKNVTWTSSNEEVATVIGDNTQATITGITGGTTNITVTTEEGNKTATCSVTVLEAGVIEQEGETVWDSSSHTASITIKTTSQGYVFEYQKNSSTGTWTQINGNQITINELNHGDIIYARTRYGTEVNEEASFNIQDLKSPNAPTISLSSNSVKQGESLTATIKHTDNQSGVNIKNCKYIFNTKSTQIGITSSTWNTANVFTNNPQTITLDTNTSGTYYLHILTTDNAGNKIETISEAVQINKPTITLSAYSTNIEVGNTVTITATTKPTSEEVTWSIGNTSIATISANSKNVTVTGITEGSTILKCILKSDSSVVAQCSINVVAPADAVAKRDGVYYTSIRAAVPETKTQSTIYLLKNTTERVSISADRNIILDLNGHTLTGYIYYYYGGSRRKFDT